MVVHVVIFPECLIFGILATKNKHGFLYFKKALKAIFLENSLQMLPIKALLWKALLQC